MNKVVVTFLHKENCKFTFEFKELSDAFKEYNKQCKYIGDHAGYVDGEWLISLVINSNIYKQLKLTSTRP